MEADCGECSRLKESRTHEANHVILHTTARLICGPNKSKLDQKQWKKTGKTDWKKSRDGFVQKLKQQISALRNSGGGIVFVHIKDLNPEDKCLDYFHELVDVRLNDMIEDGSLFVNIYKKDWLGDDFAYTNVVALTVSPSVSVVTLDYKTKLPLDNSIIDPSGPAILKYLKHSCKFTENEAIIRGLDDSKLRESRQVQVKAYFVNGDNVTQDINVFVDYIWEDLRLREYITSFSKIDGGGSYYIGIQEEEINYESYSTKRLIKKGFQFPFSPAQFTDLLKKKVEDEAVIVVKDDDGVKFIKTSDFIKVALHEVKEIREHCVLEVAVGAVEGLVFYDQHGPEAYEIDDDATDDKIKRIKLEDWYKRQLKQFRN